MNTDEIVSIICTCFNHEKFVLEALDSVIKQTYSNIEIIIIDDASIDNSVEKIDNWIVDKPKIKFIRNKTNLGVTKSFNKAFLSSTGKYIFDFATDDILYPDAIAQLLTKFNNSNFKKLGLVYANLENISEKGDFISYYFNNEYIPTGAIFKNIIDSGKTICSPTALISRKVFEDLKGYDENLMYEDLDFWIRLSRIYEIDYLNEVLLKKRVTQNSLGNQFYTRKNGKKMAKSTNIILKKSFSLCVSKDELKSLLRRIHYEIQLNLSQKNIIMIIQLLILKLKIHLNLLLK